MYNVLIVDDEPNIREGLRSLVPWTDYGFQVIDTAGDGRIALEKYGNYAVDLMIVDIRMPGMDGLELIQTIRKTNSDIQFIILSGYSDFQYAQKAITANVAGYLLKPVDEDELVEYLEKLKTKLDKDKTLTQLRTNHLANQNQNFLQTLLDSNHPSEIQTLKQEAIQLDLIWKKYHLILIKILPSHELDIHQLDAKKHKLVQIFEPQKGIVFIHDFHIGLLLKEPATAKESQRNLAVILEKVFDQEKILCSLSEVFIHLFELKDAYNEAKTLLDHQFFYHEKGFLQKQSKPFLPKNEPSSKDPVRNEFPLHYFAGKIYYAIDIANKDAVEERLKEAAQAMVNLDFSEMEVKKSFMKLLTTVSSKCSTAKPEIQPIITELLANIVEIDHQTNLYKLIQYVNSSFRKIIETLDVGDHTVQIKKVADFIQRNYHENLKLETLAEVFNYNSAYLGKLFKNYTGEYFNTYLDQVRMENAKTLLSHGLKVYQVAERVGYTNVDYFHNKFKKHVGMSPTTYRKNRVLDTPQTLSKEDL